MKFITLIFLGILSIKGFSQINVIKATNKRLEFEFINDSTKAAFFFNPYAFVTPKGGKYTYKPFIREDRVFLNNDTMIVYISDTSFVNRFQSFNFLDSFAKIAGIYNYEYINPGKTIFFKILITVPNKCKYLKLFYNFSYADFDRKNLKYTIIKLPYHKK